MSLQHKTPADYRDPAPETARPIIRLDKISRFYSPARSLFSGQGAKVVALNQVSLSILPGEILGLVGESGSGKTTTGRLIVRLEMPDQGRLFFEETDSATFTGRQLAGFRSRVQMIFQDPYQSLNPHLSVLESISEPMVIHKIGSRRDQFHQTIQALAFVGLKPPETYIHRYPHQLSGGQRQRVAIARAMILNPAFIVADEPTSMLDASIQLQIFNILRSLKQTLGASLLFITHSMPAARYLCDRIAVIYKGAIMEIGPAAAVIHHPGHPYTQALIDAVPNLGVFARRSANTLRQNPRNDVNGPHCPFFTRCRPAIPGRCDAQTPTLEPLIKNHLTACFLNQKK